MSEKEDILSRLKKIEGQIRGIQRIVDEERSCSDVITQLLAASKALDKVSIIVAGKSLKDCFRENLASGDNSEKAMENSLSLLLNLVRREG